MGNGIYSLCETMPYKIRFMFGKISWNLLVQLNLLLDVDDIFLTSFWMYRDTTRWSISILAGGSTCADLCGSLLWWTSWSGQSCNAKIRQRRKGTARSCPANIDLLRCALLVRPKFTSYVVLTDWWMGFSVLFQLMWRSGGWILQCGCLIEIMDG
jgi:hypothetical protein